MASKAEEIKALEKMQKMVEALGGEDSYIGMTFKGVWEEAYSNIDNDWGCNPMNEIKVLRDSLEDMKKERQALKDSKAAAEKELEEAKKDLEDCRKNAKFWFDKFTETETHSDENAVAYVEEKAKAEALELENMKLKAKLFDLLYAEK